MTQEIKTLTAHNLPQFTYKLQEAFTEGWRLEADLETVTSSHCPRKIGTSYFTYLFKGDVTKGVEVVEEPEEDNEEPVELTDTSFRTIRSGRDLISWAEEKAVALPKGHTKAAQIKTFLETLVAGETVEEVQEEAPTKEGVEGVLATEVQED